MRKRIITANKNKLSEMEKKLKKFMVDKKYGIDIKKFSFYLIWLDLEKELIDCYNKMDSNVKMKLMPFMGLPNVKIVKDLEFTNSILEDRIYLFFQNEFDFLFFEKDKKFWPFPKQIGRFIHRKCKYEIDGKPTYNISQDTICNIIPVLLTENFLDYNDNSLNLFLNNYIPSVVIDKNRLFIICVPVHASIDKLFRYRKELSQIFNNHFANRKGAPKSKDKVCIQSLLNEMFTELNESKPGLSQERKYQLIAKKLNEAYGIKLRPSTLKKEYAPKFKKTIPLADLVKQIEEGNKK